MTHCFKLEKKGDAKKKKPLIVDWFGSVEGQGQTGKERGARAQKVESSIEVEPENTGENETKPPCASQDRLFLKKVSYK